jgi:hypothetical protein
MHGGFIVCIYLGSHINSEGINGEMNRYIKTTYTFYYIIKGTLRNTDFAQLRKNSSRSMFETD